MSKEGLELTHMAEVLTEFSEPIVDVDGIAYRAQATGAPMPDGMGEGWIEFIPIAGGTPVRTPRETTQQTAAMLFTGRQV